MLIGIGASIYSGNRYDAAISSANLAARFDAALGITSSGGFASAWADQSGNGRNLLQATGANQPIHLPFAGTKYGWLPGVAGNYFSTPDSVANSITGDIDIRVKFSSTAFATGNQFLASKLLTGGNYSYDFYVSSGSLVFRVSTDGSAVKTAVMLATGSFSDNTVAWARATRAAASGDVKFYASSDGSTWTQVGTTQATAAGGVFDGTEVLTVGSQLGGANPLSGKIYRAQIYNGIDGTLAVDLDPSRWTSGTTFTGSTGETWTINSTGSKPAQIVDRPSLLFDGAAHYMKCASFTLNQPETVYLVAKQVSWTDGDFVFDGNASSLMAVFQTGGTPFLRAYAGASLSGAGTSLTIGNTGIITAVFNGASSVLQVNSQTAATGDAGASNGGGFTIGARGDAVQCGNIQAYEALIYSVAHDEATRSNIRRALMAKHGVA